MATPTVVDPATRVYRTVNPTTGKVVREFAPLSDTEAMALLTRAHEAYLTWRAVPVADRAKLLLRFSELVEANKDELARLVTLEMGKPLDQAKGEVDIVGAIFRYYAQHGEEMLADQEVKVEGYSQVITRREAVGVIVGIEPWNAPLYQSMRASAPNIMLGNTVLIKPAEASAASTLFLDHLFTEAGFPADVYQTALVSTAQISAYIADPRVRGVALTGSDRAGSAVAEQAGRNIKPVVLELGGSDAFIVLDSADVDMAAGAAANARLFGGGQVCVSPKRVILTDAVADEFIPVYTQVFASATIGDPFDPTTTVGPLVSPTAVDTLQEQYDDAVAKGATVLVPGGRVDGPGAFFKPAVLAGITPAMRLYSEEAFGPLGMIYRVPDADAAVKLANDTHYGLNGTVFSRDLDEARRVAGQLDTGIVGINNYFAGPVEIPFGGTKSSGIGRELGRSGMDQFANIKTYGLI